MDEIQENNIKSTDPLNTLMINLVKEKGGSPELYRDMLDKLAYHESAGTMDPKIKQYSGGPGRGKYQFEGEGGSNRILYSAVRTKKYFKKIGAKVPDFVESIIKKGTEDATNLTSEQQDMLVLGDLRMKKGVDLSNYVKGKTKLEDIWADHWWAGSKDLRDKRVKLFRDSTSRFESKYGVANRPIAQNKPNINIETGNVIDNSSVSPRDLPEFQSYKQPTMVAPQINPSRAEMNPEVFKSDFTDFLRQHVSNVSEKKKLNSFNSGGTHEQNAYGGIPQGIASNGQMNTVEEGETSFEIDNSKFIFSDRIILE